MRSAVDRNVASARNLWWASTEAQWRTADAPVRKWEEHEWEMRSRNALHRKGKPVAANEVRDNPDRTSVHPGSLRDDRKRRISREGGAAGESSSGGVLLSSVRLPFVLPGRQTRQEAS
jgi:hypothetical protein